MPIVPPKQATSWSFSRYSDYKMCPLRFRLKHLDKIPEPSSPALERGAAIHTMAEQYIKGKLRRMPPELKSFEAEFKALKAQYKKPAHGMVVEDSWSFTKDWTETQWDDWAGCMVRIKLDCAHHEDHETLVITDWKTGKFRPELNTEYIEQLELYALAALLLHDHIEKVKPRLVYLDAGLIYPTDDSLVFTKADVPKLKKLWAQRTKPMLNDKRFAPRPNDKCRFCWYRASNKEPGGGRCKF